MKADSPYSEVPELASAFAPQYRTQHYHMHGRNIQNWESLRSVFLDQHHTVNVLGLKILKGALVGATYGYIARNFIWRGPKSFEMDRLWLLNKGSPMTSPLRGYITFGALMGAAWWFIKDVICVPHGADTQNRHLIAYGLMGGVIISTIVHPVNFIYGFLAGVAFGGVKLSMNSRSLPRGMQWKMKSADPQKRRKLLRQDEEYELSQRHVLSTKNNFYPL